MSGERPSDKCACLHARRAHSPRCGEPSCGCKAFTLNWERAYPDGRNERISQLELELANKDAELADRHQYIKSLEALLRKRFAVETKGHVR